MIEVKILNTDGEYKEIDCELISVDIPKNINPESLIKDFRRIGDMYEKMASNSTDLGEWWSYADTECRKRYNSLSLSRKVEIRRSMKCLRV